MTVTPTIHNWPELSTSVDDNQGVLRTSLAALRELEGRQRSGKHIVAAIEKKLASLGLGHLPENLANRQQQVIVLYKLGTPASELVRAIKEGLTETSAPESAYTFLHQFNSMPNPNEIVRRDEVDETVKEEVSTAIEEAAVSVLEMLAKAHPHSAMGGNGGRGKVDGERSPLDLIATLSQRVPSEFSDRK